MSAPSLIAARRFSQETRLRLNILFARAFETLAETHQAQAAAFARRLRGRFAVEEALDRYVREVGVPAAMEETVRARALIAVAQLAEASPVPGSEPLHGWGQLSPEQLFDAIRRRVQTKEETSLECRMAASLAEEAVAAAHVSMALETAELLADEVPAEAAIMHYVRSLDLAAVEAQIVFRRALAHWAQRHPIGVPEPKAATFCPPTRVPTLSFRGRLPLGLRMIG